MPPRKRAKLSAASTPQDTTSTEPVAVEKPATTPIDDVLNDPWTDDEYTELFKAMIRWKPTGRFVCFNLPEFHSKAASQQPYSHLRLETFSNLKFLIGMYKHFRMISISNALSSHGYSYNSTSGSHTRIPGIWAKLQALYDLDALDEREDRHAGYVTPDPSSVGEDGGEEEEEERSSISLQEFALNEEEFGEMMWARRLKVDNSEGKLNRRLHTSVDGHSSPEAIEGLSHTKPRKGLFLSRDGTAEAEDTVSSKGKGKKSASVASTKVRGRAARGTPAEELDEEDEEEAEEEEEGSTQAGSPPSRATVKNVKKSKAVSSARRSTRKR